MVAFHPDDFDLSFWIRELSDVGKKAPMLACEPPEIQVGEDIAEENQPPKREGMQDVEGILGPTDIGSEMHVGEEQGI